MEKNEEGFNGQAGRRFQRVRREEVHEHADGAGRDAVNGLEKANVKDSVLGREYDAILAPRPAGGYAACDPKSYGSRMRQGTVMTLGSPG